MRTENPPSARVALSNVRRVKRLNVPFALARGAALVTAIIGTACSPSVTVPRTGPSAGPQVARATAATVTKLYKTAGNPAWGMTTGPDGNVWFAAFNKLSYGGRLTLAGQLTFFRIHIKGYTADRIVAGSDGNLWIDDGNAGLVKMSVAGALTVYPLNTASFFCCNALAPVANGEMWVGAQNSNTGVILKIDRNAHVLEHFVPNSGQFAAGSIVPETNDSVWITTVEQFTEGTILELVAPSGVVRTLHVAKLGLSMVRGGDGNLWLPHYTERIARITTAGVVTDFSTGPESHPQELTVGPDGSIWFTMYQGRSWLAAHMNLKGQIVGRYPLPPGALPVAVCVGKDGRVWVSYTVKATSIFGNPETVGRIEEFEPAQ